jgi:hypothetical protein
MTEAFIFAGVAVAIGGYLMLRRPSWAGVVLFIGLLSGVVMAVLGSLGLPRPGCNLTKEATVIAFSLDEGHAIYLWLQTAGAPLSCELPWNEKQAAQISDAAGDAQSQGVALKIKVKGTGKPGEPGTKDDEEFLAYPAPQAPLPPKQGE